MGNKGDKETSKSEETANIIMEHLQGLDDVSAKKMFGGHGIFVDKKMFCIVDPKGNGFLKVDDSNAADYHAAGSEQHSRMPYFSIPDDALLSREIFITWAEKSMKIAK